MADGSSIERIDLWRLRAPLKRPYKLAFGAQTAFDCLIVGARRRDGADGCGEAALLPGYTDETIESAWSLATGLAEQLIGRDAAAVEALLSSLGPERAFTATAFRTACEQAAGHPALARSGRARLLGAVSRASDDAAALADEVEALIAAGFRTLKVKVGWDVASDLTAVARLQDALGGRARLRVDGNQGFATAAGVAFVSGLDPEGVELVEQPCAAGDWAAATAVKRAARAPIMLDESIYGEADIRRAADLGCADYVKLKLMKMGGLDRLIAGLRLVRALGMRPVLGNGVATDLGCWMEGCVALTEVDTDGEMNGFTRPVRRLLAPPLETDGADMLLDGRARRPDMAALDALAVERRRFPAQPAGRL